MAKMTDRELNYTLNLSRVMVAAEEAAHHTAAVRKAKLEAYIDTARRITTYQEEGIRDDLVDVVFDKRLKLIADASTADDLKKIMAQPKPHFNGNKFISDPFSVPEEEMILWSLTSLKAPLMNHAFERYFELFKQVFGLDSIDGDALMRAAELRLEVKCDA